MKIECPHGVTFIARTQRTTDKTIASIVEIIRPDGTKSTVQSFEYSTYAQPVQRVRGIAYREAVRSANVLAENFMYLN